MKKQIVLFIILTFLTSTGYAQQSLPKQDGGRKEDAFTFAFITDTHVIYNLGNLQDYELPSSRESLIDAPFIGYERLLKEIKEKSVDFILTGGDNIDFATYQRPPIDGKLPVAEDTAIVSKYIARMKKMAKAQGLPVYYALGNHDVYAYPPAKPEDPMYGQGFFARNFGYQGHPYYSFDKKGWHFIVLSTFDGNGLKTAVSEKQLDWLRNDLNGTDKTTPVVLVSHVPFPVARGCELLSKTIYEIIKNHQVRLGLFGHLHCYHEFDWNGIPCVVGSSASGAVWSLVRNVSDVNLGQINKGTSQGYLIVHVSGRDISWNHYPFSYSIEQYRLETTGKTSVASYNHVK